MKMKTWAVGVIVGMFAWQTVQASSISTRVRVLENKVSQFERQLNQERAQQQSQVKQVQTNTRAIQALQQEVETLQYYKAKNKKSGSSSKAGRYSSGYISNNRFTDSRYAYP